MARTKPFCLVQHERHEVYVRTKDHIMSAKQLRQIALATVVAIVLTVIIIVWLAPVG